MRKLMALAGVVCATAATATAAEAAPKPAPNCFPGENGATICVTSVDTDKFKLGQKECMVRETQIDLIRPRFEIFKETTEVFDADGRRIFHEVIQGREYAGYIILGPCPIKPQA